MNIISEVIWNDSIKFIEFQISQVKGRKINKSYCIPMIFYYSANQAFIDRAKGKKYLADNIKTGIFYAYDAHYFSMPYIVPKGSAGMREWRLLSPGMYMVYNAACIYLFRLTRGWFENTISIFRENIRSFYGGNLSLTQSNGLLISHQNTSYINHYREFKKEVRECSEKFDIVIQLDIENFFDNIDVRHTLVMLHEHLSYTARQEYKFDNNSIDELVDLFEFIMDGKIGIPQFENNLFSPFFAHLLMTMWDLHCLKILKRDNNLAGYKIVRYVDDAYIFLKMKKYDRNLSRVFAPDLLGHIIEMTKVKLALKSNAKTGIYDLNNDSERDEVLQNLKRTSNTKFALEDMDDDAPNKSFQDIIDNINSIKNEWITTKKASKGSKFSEIMKYAYSKKIIEYSKSDDGRQAIKESFKDFNFEMVKLAPKPIIALITAEESVESRFKRYYSSKKYPNYSDIDVIMKYISHYNFSDNELEILDIPSRKYKWINEILLSLKFKNKDETHVYGMKYVYVYRLRSNRNLIMQIRSRKVAEQSGRWSLALNHLLNELHYVCFLLEKIRNKDYDAMAVCRYLNKRHISPVDIITVRNMFDRRNSNTISHSGLPSEQLSYVSREEYLRYREVIYRVISLIITKKE